MQAPDQTALRPQLRHCPSGLGRTSATYWMPVGFTSAKSRVFIPFGGPKGYDDSFPSCRPDCIRPRRMQFVAQVKKPALLTRNSRVGVGFLWGGMPFCAAIGNRRACRLPVGTQVAFGQPVGMALRATKRDESRRERLNPASIQYVGADPVKIVGAVEISRPTTCLIGSPHLNQSVYAARRQYETVRNFHP